MVLKMYTIIQKDRWGYITPEPNRLEINRLLSKLSYTRPNARFLTNPVWGHVQLYDEKKHRFPIGLMHRVKEVIPISTYRSEKVFLELSYGDLRPYQIDALNKMNENSNGIIKIATGGGKTRVAIQFLKNVNLPTLVLVPTLDLVRQWSEQVPKNVHVKTYQSIKKKAYVQQFDIVIFDECHHCAAKTLYKIGMNCKESTRVYGLSATPLDRETDNMKVEAVLGTIIYEIGTRKLIELGYLCDAKIYYHDLEEMYFEYITYPEVYDEYIVYNKERNDKIINLAKQSKYPLLILISRIEHGQMLYDALKDLDVVYLNGQTKDRDDLNHDIIIATNIFDEGIDIPDLKTLIIGAGGKSSIQTTQRIGRLLRPSENKDYAIIHDFKDDCKWLDKHYKQRRKIFSKDFEVYDDNF